MRTATGPASVILAALWFTAAAAQPVPAVQPQDRATVEACLKKAGDNAAVDAQIPEDKKPVPTTDPAAFLNWNARAAPMQKSACIGIINKPCQEKPDGSSTAGMIFCLKREYAVWDERLNRVYRKALQSKGEKYTAALQKAQRAWLVWRDARCALPAVEYEGGTIIGPLTAVCLMEMTARQAIWLEESDE